MAEPATSVVVPTRDRPEALARCLAALAAVEPPAGGLEVIVVDDGGDADLAPVVGRAAPLAARLLRVPWGGPAAARNAGVAAARGERVLFTDDDCLPDRRWAVEMSRALAGGGAPALVGGRTLNALPASACDSASQLVVELAYEYHGGFAAPTFFASNNLGAPRRALEELGGFDPSFRTSEDRDLCDRWRARDWPLVGAPQAEILHAHELDLPRFLRQHFGYGRGAYRLHRARRRRSAGAPTLDPSFHLRLVRDAPRRARATRAGSWRVLPLLLLWQLANLAGFVFAAARGESASRA